VFLVARATFRRVRRSDPSAQPATAEDLLALPADHAAEVIDGQLIYKAVPSFDHGNAQAGISGALLGFRGPSGGGPGPGGWWIATEVDVEYEPTQVFRHDVVGWRRDRVPERPAERPVRVRPDWACEILSPSNASNDTVKKLRALHAHRVPHYWLLDPDAGTLRVLRWMQDGYLEALSATADEVVSAEPFQTAELDLKRVLGRL
jgi:Uma2 family endonuclease